MLGSVFQQVRVFEVQDLTHAHCELVTDSHLGNVEGWRRARLTHWVRFTRCALPPAEVKPERLGSLQASAVCVPLGPFQDGEQFRWVALIR